MSEQEENNLLPEGFYDAVAVEKVDDQGVIAFARWSKSNGGKKQVSAHFKLLAHPEAFPVPWYGSFSGETLGKKGKTVAERTVESLRYMGFKGNDFLELERQPLNQIVSVQVEHNEWEGKVSLRVAWVNMPGGGVVKIKNPLPQDELRQFAGLMRNSLDKVPEVNGERWAPPAASTDAGASNGAHAAPPASHGGHEQPPPPMEDDIPF